MDGNVMKELEALQRAVVDERHGHSLDDAHEIFKRTCVRVRLSCARVTINICHTDVLPCRRTMVTCGRRSRILVGMFNIPTRL